MRKTILLTAALTIIAGAASAQTASVALSAATHNTAAGWAGTENLVAFRGLGVTREATPRFIYQDRNADAAVTTANRNSLWQWNGTGAPTQLCTQAAVVNAVNAVSGTDSDGDSLFGVFDMEGDASGNIFIATSIGIAGGSTLFREDIVRISPAGAVTVVATSGSNGAENAEGVNSLAYDAANDRLYVHIDNFSSSHGVGVGAGVNGNGTRGIHVINNASTASNVTLNASTLIISEADLNTALVAGNASGGGSSTDGNAYDITFRPIQNDLIVSNINTTNDNDDLFRVTPLTVGSGACTLFIDSNQIEAALTNERFFGAGSLAPIADQSLDNSYFTVREATGDIYFTNCTPAATSAYTTNRRSIAFIKADGSQIQNVIAEQSASQDLHGDTTHTFLNGTGANPTDRALRFLEKTPAENSELYCLGENNAGAEGIIRVTGFIVGSGPASTEGGWSLYE